jgi:hypothetical protein
VRPPYIPLLLGWVFTTGIHPAAAQQLFNTDRLTGRQQEAEERPELETDRDAFTPATSTVGRRTSVLESSYSFIDNRNVAETHSFPETLVRFGLGERLEARLGWNFEVGGAGDVISGNSASEEASEGEIERESQMLYGFKARLTDQRGWLPRSATIVQAYTPTSGESPATDYLFAYVFGWELAERFRLDSSMRYGSEHDRHDEFNQWAPSMALRYSINQRWHAHIEYFGIYSDNAEHDFSRAFLSPGAHVLVTENLELGMRLGWGLTDDSPNFFSNFGVGWRF